MPVGGSTDPGPSTFWSRSSRDRFPFTGIIEKKKNSWELLIFDDYDELSTAAPKWKSAHEFDVMCIWDLRHRCAFDEMRKNTELPPNWKSSRWGDHMVGHKMDLHDGLRTDKNTHEQRMSSIATRKWWHWMSASKRHWRQSLHDHERSRDSRARRHQCRGPI